MTQSPGDADAQRVLATARTALGDVGAGRQRWLVAALLEPAETAAAPDLPPELADLVAQAEELALPGEPADWLPALADLEGLASLPPEARWPPITREVAARPGITFARDLAALRAARRRRAPEDETRPLKAALLRAAPGLRERLRPS